MFVPKRPWLVFACILAVALIAAIAILDAKQSLIALAVAFVLICLVQLGQIVWQVSCAAAWVTRWGTRQARRLLRRGPSGARTTPDRNGQPSHR